MSIANTFARVANSLSAFQTPNMSSQAADGMKASAPDPDDPAAAAAAAEKERLLAEKNLRRSTFLAKTFGNFIKSHQEASKIEYLRRFPPPGIPKAKKDPKDKKKEGGKDGKGKKPEPTPITEAWLLLLKDLDELIFKKKRAGDCPLLQRRGCFGLTNAMMLRLVLLLRMLPVP